METTDTTTAKRGAARRERERARHREEILRAAERIFAERGFEGASMADIAAAAEFSVGSLYNFFRDKEDLGEEVMARICRERAESLEALAARRLPPAGALAALADGFARHVAAHGAFLRMSIRLQSARGRNEPPPHIAALVGRQRAALVAVMAGAAAAGGMRPLPPEDLAVAALGLCIHFAADRRLRGGGVGAADERELAGKIGSVLAALLLDGKGAR